MRENYKKQMPLTITSIDHPHAEELEGISQILDANPIIYEWVLQDLSQSPAITRFLILVFCSGLISRMSFEGMNVALFSLMIL